MDTFSAAKNVVPLTRSETVGLDEHVSHLLRCAHKRASSVVLKELGDSHLTPAQFFALLRLFERGQMSQNHLGRLTAMDPATIQGVIHRLQARGLIERQPDRNDRRRIALRLTSAGRRAVEELRAHHMVKLNEAILEPLNPNERKLFVRLLKRLA